METIKKSQIAFALTPELKNRVDTFLKSDVSPVKSRQKLFEAAVIQYLEREEPILKILEKQLLKIREKYS